MRHFLIGLLMFGSWLIAGPPSDWNLVQPEPGTEWKVTWGLEPEVGITSTRGERVLNGLWGFQPSVEKPDADEQAPWGLIQVPGSWRESWSQPRLITQGTKGVWEGYGRGHDTWRAWYRRTLKVPEHWDGRRILLDVSRVSTDAEIFLDGQKAGEVNWPGGEVDLTALVKPGETQELRLRVLAVEKNEMVSTMMGTEEGHNRMVRQRLPTYGIIGDVILRSEPMESPVQQLRFTSRVSDDRFDLSWKQDLEEKLRVEADFLSPDGEVEKRFKKHVTPKHGTASVTWKWTSPRLWDVGQPELYELRLRVFRGKTLLDEISRRVAFREFEINGKDFYLNGKRIRLRPTSASVYYKGIRKLNEGLIEGLIATGHNMLHYWPNDPLRRGSVIDYDQVAEIADEKGVLISLPLPAFYDLVKVEDPSQDTINLWKQTVLWTMNSLGHHPSVVVWGCSPNFFGHGDDQNPRRIGRNTEVPSMDWTRRAERADRWISWIKEQDPTRAVLIHQGASVGDIYATNTYLCLLPLQEREEWLSHWAEHGEKPFMGVEFGTPLDGTFTRGRNNGANAGASEPLLTEHAVSYLGPSAYLREPSSYRKKLAELQAMGVREPHWHGNAFLNQEPLFQEMQQLFLTNTGRSWRSWGLSAGVVHWAISASLFPNDWRGGNYDGWSREPKPPFVPGSKGTYFWRSGYPLAFSRFWQETGATTYQPAARDFLKINAETLAYIGGGKEEHWADKTHHFTSGSRFGKQIMMVNDSRSKARFSGELTVSVEGQEIYQRSVNETLDVSEIHSEPFRVTLPNVEKMTEGMITLKLKQGERIIEDTFSFRVYPKVEPTNVSRTVRVFEQDGSATTLLEGAGVKPEPAKNDLPQSGILVLGRNIVDDLPWTWETLAAWVKQGNRLLIMGQSPQIMHLHTDVRVSRYVTRRFWPVSSVASHPLVEGLDGEDFRDWPGRGTLVPPEENTGFDHPVNTAPTFGYRWGTRGSVSSAAWEIPHHSGWKPLLQGEFDLSYSPLMTLELGRGHVLFCGLDLEERDAENPVGDLLLQRLLTWLDQVEEGEPKGPVRLMGSPAFHDRMTSLGLQTAEEAGLWVVGEGASLTESDVEAHLMTGGRILRLDREGTPGVWSGLQELPAWPELSGLRLGDLRPRLDTELGLLDGSVLAHRKVGEGVELSYQLLPEHFAGQSYLRYSRWNSTRALSRLLSNMGAAFERDQQLLATEENPFSPVVLPLEWRYGVETSLPPVKSLENVPEDEGNRKLEAGWHKRDFDDSSWIKAPVLGGWERNVESFETFDGAMWMRVTIDVPKEWKGYGDAVLELHKVDDFDITYVNGFRVGKTGKETENAWNHSRAYPVRSWMLKPGEKNVIAIRIFDHFGGGGFTGYEQSLYRLRLANPPLREGLYHADYREDRALGDNPFRYYRW